MKKLTDKEVIALIRKWLDKDLTWVQYTFKLNQANISLDQALKIYKNYAIRSCLLWAFSSVLLILTILTIRFFVLKG